MASAVPADSNDTLKCSVCHDFFKDPKLLPCGHLMCRDCLLSWLESKKSASCPLCRHWIMDADSGGDFKEFADMLPTDLSMVRLVEAEQLLHKQHQCCACAAVVATSLCLSCRDMMCKSCAKLHTRFSISKNHTVEALSSLTPEKLAANKPPPTCAYHANEVCTLYCPTHEELICHTCAVTRHRQCQEVKELEERVSEAHAVLAELVKKLKEGQVMMNHSIEQLDQHLQETEKKTQTLMAEIEAVCDKLESAVKECRRHLKELVHRAGAEVKDAVQDGKTYLLQQKGKVTCHSIVAERIQETKAKDEVLTMTAMMKSRVDDLDLSATLPADFKVISAVKMEISPQVVSEVEAKLRELAEVQCVPADVKAQPKVEMNEVLSGMSYNYNMVGVALQAPDTISVPSAVYWSSSFAAVIDHRRVLNQGRERRSNLGAPLENVDVGSRVGLLLDSRRDVHLYLDGRDLGVFASAIPEPCFFLMDLIGRWKKVTTLPLEPVS
ncbi:E3 ubiquitin-protein ligase TRIM56-like isoform X2 [Babylonia areolata]|uniref:E3 ubiquitin-protein ligase TRIM56-like isoform X2 n=1 Tax=Babylonia areolata TaxID=304850 RepID=UPI003FD1F8A0